MYIKNLHQKLHQKLHERSDPHSIREEGKKREEKNSPCEKTLMGGETPTYLVATRIINFPHIYQSRHVRKY